MTYLDLINAVLTRLREPIIAASSVDSNPYYRAIGGFVNDAKKTIEDAWDWTALRGYETVVTASNVSVMQIPNSIDNNYRVTSVRNNTTGQYLEQITESEGAKLYQDEFINPLPLGAVTGWFYFGTYWNPTNDSDVNNGLQQIRFTTPPDGSYLLNIYKTSRQAPLVQWDAKIKIPSTPVYYLAAALASRERGEVSGEPTSELFSMASLTLSDAISLDSTKHPEELIWYVP